MTLLEKEWLTLQSGVSGKLTVTTRKHQLVPQEKSQQYLEGLGDKKTF